MKLSYHLGGARTADPRYRTGRRRFLGEADKRQNQRQGNIAVLRTQKSGFRTAPEASK